jgi:hypothetical protein
VKYAILPQALTPAELIGGNGLVEMGTFVAILAGTLVAGVIGKKKFIYDLWGDTVNLASVMSFIAQRFCIFLISFLMKKAGAPSLLDESAGL